MVQRSPFVTLWRGRMRTAFPSSLNFPYEVHKTVREREDQGKERIVRELKLKGGRSRVATWGGWWAGAWVQQRKDDQRCPLRLSVGTPSKNGVMWELSVLVRKQDKCLVTQCLQSTELFLECVFALLPAVVDKTELTSNYSLQPAVIMYFMPLWKNMFCHMRLVLVIVHFTQVTLLNPQSINCLVLWRKLAIVWGFNLPYFQATCSEAPPPLQRWLVWDNLVKHTQHLSCSWRHCDEAIKA